MIHLALGVILTTPITFVAYKKASLNLSGAVAATFLGVLIYFWGGLFMWLIMIGFFISSSLLSKVGREQKAITDKINEKGARRDVIQVIANGGLGFVFAYFYHLTQMEVFLLAYAVAFASSSADTWSSELGVLSKKAPVSILTLKQVNAGTSGAVSALGILAAFLGAAFISAVFFVGFTIKYGFNDLLVIMTLLCLAGGVLGAFIDSVIGAKFQGKYYCQVCHTVTEKKHHHGMKTIHQEGWRFINNDLVNFTSTTMASVIIIVIFQLL